MSGNAGPALLAVAHLAALLGLPLLLLGLIVRVKALAAGRRGPPLLQPFFDVARLLGKRPVYSEVTTWVFRAGPPVVLATALLAGLMTPLLGAATPLGLPYDFVLVAYLWGLGRLAQVLAALDTGSAFEGMGASREATFSALVEPALFLALGTLAATSGRATFADLLAGGARGPAQWVVVAGCAAALFVVLLVEAARVPVDDPTTHLELTMIHEVMILDHSGPDLAFLQYGAALKLTSLAGLLAVLVNPVPAAAGGLAVAAGALGLTLLVAVLVGLVESLTARLRLTSVPQLLLGALVSALVALLTSAWWQGGGR